MRRHENIGYGSFNTYRSGDENSRQYDYGNQASNARGGRSVYGQMSRDTDASDRLYSTSGGYGSASSNDDYTNRSASNYGSSSQYGQQNSYQSQPSGSYQSQSNQSWMNQNQNQSPSNQYRSQSQGSHYSPSGSYGSYSYGGSGSASGSDSYGNRNADRNDSLMDRTGNRMENWADRAGNQVERWGDRISNAWDRATDDDDNRYRSSNRGWMGQQDMSHGARYSHGNASQNRYSDNYDSPSSSSYGGRYEPGSNYNRYEENRGRYEDEGGFFDHLGNRISNAWDRWIGNDDEEQRRYERRSRYGNSGNRSDRDYNW